MPKTKISEYSSTANSNTDIGGINVDEGCAPSGINDAIRTMMAQLKNFQTGTGSDSFNGPVGSTTASTGAFTTLTTSSTVTHNGGTANGVAYLNGSKVLTTGSALVFDGTNLGVGVTPSAWGTGTSYRALQIGAGSSLAGWSSDAGTELSSNAYFNSGWKYIATAVAARYQIASTGVHAWYNAASGTAGNAITFTQAMTLDASGNLGVGTTSPATKLHVSYAGSLGSRIENTSGTGAAYSQVKNTAGSTFLGQDSTGGYLLTDYAAPLLFYTNNSERARIDSSGNFLVGQTGTGLQAARSFSFQGVGDGTCYISHSTANGGGDTFVRFGYNANLIGSITQNGTTGVLYNVMSDYRLKTVIGPVVGAGQRIDSLEPIEHTWGSDGSRTRGFLAHKFQEIYPNSVTGTKDAVDNEGKPVYQAMQASSPEVIADLVAEIQSLRQRVAQLESN